jgi:DNA-directed RNA polymerase specialized sigma24 family protein
MPDHIEYEARTVRPYAVTGGRVKSSRSDLPLEALVELMPGAVAGTKLPPERRAILHHAAAGYISIAELSALLHLPLGVIRVLVSDLADQQYVRVHSTQPLDVETGQSPALSLSVLESVLNGIAAL